MRSVGPALTIALMLTGCGSGEPPGSNQTSADAGVPAPDGQGKAEGQAEIGPSVSEDFPAKVKSDWLPQVSKMSLSPPQSVDDIWKQEGFFELMAANLDGDRLVDEQGKPKPDTPPMAAARKTLRAALASKQARVFPILRRTFVKLSAEKMWANNVEVAGVGRRIIYTAPMFADNAAVQGAEEASAAELQKLRFSHAEYAWYHGGRAWSYDLKTPPDSVAGIWPSVSSGEFEPVK